MEGAVSRILKWNNSELKELANGVKLICRVPSIAPDAWLHTIYRGLNDIQINKLQKDLGMPTPYIYEKFLRETNGLNIFSDTLRLMGLRTSYVRVGEEARQPYDIQAFNEFRDRTSKNWLFFGSYNWDGTRVFFDLAEGKETIKVGYAERRTNNIIHVWPNFDVWLESEIERLGRYFDSSGVRLDKTAPTSPRTML